MAVSVATISGDHLVHDSLKRGTRLPKIGLDDSHMQHGLRSRIKALAHFWEELKDCKSSRRFNGIKRNAKSTVTCDTQNSDECDKEQEFLEHLGRIARAERRLRSYEGANSLVTSEIFVDLFKPYGTVIPAAVPPPTYEESIQDSPPDYTNTEALATAQVTKYGVETAAYNFADQKLHPSILASHVKVDLSDLEGIRSYANKKAKKAAKAAQQAKWADSDNEENPEGGEDGGGDPNENGGGDGGAGAGGDGGDPPGGGDGGDGGDDDWWNTGTYSSGSRVIHLQDWVSHAATAERTMNGCLVCIFEMYADIVLSRRFQKERQEKEKEECMGGKFH